jgi:hypothetical protein
VSASGYYVLLQSGRVSQDTDNRCLDGEGGGGEAERAGGTVSNRYQYRSRN